PDVHVLSSQQDSPGAPHAVHRPLEHCAPVTHEPPVQHGPPAFPHAPPSGRTPPPAPSAPPSLGPPEELDAPPSLALPVLASSLPHASTTERTMIQLRVACDFIESL